MQSVREAACLVNVMNDTIEALLQWLHWVTEHVHLQDATRLMLHARQQRTSTIGAARFDACGMCNMGQASSDAA